MAERLYPRPPNQDFENAVAFERVVKEVLPEWHIDETSSTHRLDFWVPGFFLDVKEKNQRYGPRFTGDRDQTDLFILDELSVRKALEHYPLAYFVFRDVPESRIFLASVVEVVCADRARLNRQTSEDRRKGKWVLDLSQFRELEDLGDIVRLVSQDLIGLPWKRSECLIEAIDA